MERAKQALADLAKAAVAFVKREPVIIMYAILGAVTGAAHFGFAVDPEILVGIDAILVPILAYVTRKQVTPMAELEPMTVDKFIELYGEGDQA
jgi:hypothetical protein